MVKVVLILSCVTLGIFLLGTTLFVLETLGISGDSQQVDQLKSLETSLTALQTQIDTPTLIDPSTLEADLKQLTEFSSNLKSIRENVATMLTWVDQPVGTTGSPTFNRLELSGAPTWNNFESGVMNDPTTSTSGCSASGKRILYWRIPTDNVSCIVCIYVTMALTFTGTTDNASIRITDFPYIGEFLYGRGRGCTMFTVRNPSGVQVSGGYSRESTLNDKEIIYELHCMDGNFAITPTVHTLESWGFYNL